MIYRNNHKKHPLKRKRFLFALFVVVLCVFSHFFFQFRTSDKETLRFFKKSEVSASIKYIPSNIISSKVRVIQTGNSKKNTVLFIHGAPGSGNAFYGYLKDSSLLKNAKLITFDRPGYGYSGFGKSLPSIEKQALIVDEIIQALDLKNVIVVGHSYGGPIAALSALKNNKIKDIVMLSPAIDPNSEEYFWVGNFAKWKATRWLVPRAFVVAADEKYAHAEELKTMESLWKKIPVPVLILHGKKDFLAPYKNMEYVEDYFPKTLLNSITLPNENHFIPWTKQQLIIKEIDSLIQNIQ
mgnify:CR=1 FL=1